MYVGFRIAGHVWHAVGIWPTLTDSVWVWSHRKPFPMMLRDTTDLTAVAWGIRDTLVVTRVRVVAMIAGVGVAYELERRPRPNAAYGQFSWYFMRPESLRQH